MDNGIYIVETYGRKVKYVYHWAVLVVKDNEKYIYHNSSYNQLNDKGGSVKKESWESFLTKYKPIKFIKTNLTEQQVIERTEPLLNKPYQKIFFNCNTYAKAISPEFTPIAQEKYFYIAGIILITGIIIYKANGSKI